MISGLSKKKENAFLSLLPLCIGQVVTWRKVMLLRGYPNGIEKYDGLFG